MKASQLKDIAVLNLDDAQKIGRVEDVLLNLEAGRVMAFNVKSTDGKSLSLVPVEQVQSLGHDAVTIRGEGTTIARGGPEAKAGSIKLSAFTNHQKLVTESGDLLGVVKEVIIDPSSFNITSYEVSEGGLFAKTRSIPADRSIKFGPEIAIVPANVIATGDQPQGQG